MKIKKIKIDFISTICIRPHKDYDYLTCEKIIVQVDGEFYVIPKNFTTDLASIPRIFWTFIAPFYTEIVAPSILHDYLYRSHVTCTRKHADDVFYNALIKNKVKKTTALIFYFAVRLFGGAHFKKSKEKIKNGLL